MQRRNFILRSARAALVATLGLKAHRADAIQSDDKSLIADVEKRVPLIMKEAGIPGVSAAIIRNGKIIWNKSFGVKSNAS